MKCTSTTQLLCSVTSRYVPRSLSANLNSSELTRCTCSVDRDVSQSGGNKAFIHNSVSASDLSLQPKTRQDSMNILGHDGRTLMTWCPNDAEHV